MMNSACAITFILTCHLTSFQSLFFNSSLGTDYYPSLHETHLPLHPEADPSVCVFIKGLPDTYCRIVANPPNETVPDIDSTSEDEDEGPIMRCWRPKKEPEPIPDKPPDSFVVRIPFKLSGIWSVHYYINHSIPLSMYPIRENFFVVPVSEEISPGGNNIEIDSAVSMTYPPYGSILQGGANLLFKSHPVTMQLAKSMLRVEVKEVMTMHLEVQSDFIRSDQAIEPGSWFLSVQPKHKDEKHGHIATSYVEYIISREEL